jgi:hypothetical protein
MQMGGRPLSIDEPFGKLRRKNRYLQLEVGINAVHRCRESKSGFGV